MKSVLSENFTVQLRFINVLITHVSRVYLINEENIWPGSRHEKYFKEFFSIVTQSRHGRQYSVRADKVRIQKISVFTCIFAFGLPSVAFADGPATGTDSRSPHHSARHAQSSVEIEYFNLGGSKLDTGNAQVGTSGVRIETEYEKNDMVLNFNYEKWNYDWTNQSSLPFASATSNVPWSTFNTLQFGFAYEDEIDDRWEVNYYIEAESSFEKEMSGSYEYELGVDFFYEPSEAWVFGLNVNLEYLDATGAEFGVDLGIEWNHDKKDGLSAEIELSTEFPEVSLSYHFTRQISSTLFYNESGTNTIRLSDSSPVPGMQGGYFEDEYNSLGLRLAYEFAYESYVSFSLQQNTGRTFSLVDSTGREETGTVYNLSDTTEATIRLNYAF